jgi:hypothetical protein
MPEFRGDQFLKQRMLRSSGDGNIAAVSQRHHAQRILQSLLGSDVTGYDGDCTDIQLRRVQRQHQGHGVVGAGIGVEDNFLGGAKGRSCERNQEECGD